MLNRPSAGSSGFRSCRLSQAGRSSRAGSRPARRSFVVFIIAFVGFCCKVTDNYPFSPPFKRLIPSLKRFSLFCPSLRAVGSPLRQQAGLPLQTLRSLRSLVPPLRFACGPPVHEPRAATVFRGNLPAVLRQTVPAGGSARCPGRSGGKGSAGPGEGGGGTEEERRRPRTASV